jgi:hypothetical protein
MRYTKSPRTAVERALEAFPDAPRPEKRKRPARELAFLLDALKRQRRERDAVRDAIRWAGLIPARGLSGWEEAALEWGRSER